jgi:hypothetical protein
MVPIDSPPAVVLTLVQNNISQELELLPMLWDRSFGSVVDCHPKSPYILLCICHKRMFRMCNIFELLGLFETLFWLLIFSIDLESKSIVRNWCLCSILNIQKDIIYALPCPLDSHKRTNSSLMKIIDYLRLWACKSRKNFTSFLSSVIFSLI